MEDKVKEVSHHLFANIDKLIEESGIPNEAKDIFKEMYMSIVADIAVHFSLIVNVEREGFEVWKRTMGLHDYCLGGLEEINSDSCWDVNWFKSEFNYDISPYYIELYKAFMATC